MLIERHRGMKRKNLKTEIHLGKTEYNLLDILEKIFSIAVGIMTFFTLIYTIHTNKSQDKQWMESYNAQNREIQTISSQNEILQSSLEEIKQQNKIKEKENEILRNSLNELSEQNEINKTNNEILQNSLNELTKQNEINKMINEILQNSLNELNRQTEINEKNFDLILSEKGIQCRISYLCCKYESLWNLLNDLSQDKLLIVNNDLTRVLGLEYIKNAEPYDNPESFYELTSDFGNQNHLIIVLLKIDLIGNNPILTQKLALNISEISFPQTLPIALSKLSMYSASSGIDHSGTLHEIAKYHGEKKDAVYNFSDQIVSKENNTTILCPVMIQSSMSDSSTEENQDMLTPCNTTYKVVNIPLSITFYDNVNKKTIVKGIRDLNDSSAITEYKSIVGYG